MCKRCICSDAALFQWQNRILMSPIIDYFQSAANRHLVRVDTADAFILGGPDPDGPDGPVEPLSNAAAATRGDDVTRRPRVGQTLPDSRRDAAPRSRASTPRPPRAHLRPHLEPRAGRTQRAR